MTLIANDMEAVAGRRKAVRGYLEGSAAWRHHCDTYLKVWGEACTDTLQEMLGGQCELGSLVLIIGVCCAWIGGQSSEF